MQRKTFLRAAALLSFGGIAYMKIFDQLKTNFAKSDRMPVLFVGHGSPMNAIEDNEFSRGWKDLGNTLPKPAAILCISAHWETKGSFITAMDKPKTIHDFGGFPEALYQVNYPAPGNPKLAEEIKDQIHQTELGLDLNWGLDHGAWSVIRHLYPNADIPVLQLSLDQSKDPAYHYALAKDLSDLRNRGILILASGNMVHHLGMLNWKEPESAYDWAIEANDSLKSWILNGHHQPIINYRQQGSAMQLAVPSPEHFLPLLYTLSLQHKGENISLFNDRTIMGSISMCGVRVG